MYEYMEMPQELKSVAEAFVRNGEFNGGEEIYAIEELSELIKAICKVERYPNSGSCYKDLVIEVSHVYLILNHIRIKYGIGVEEIQEAMNDKTEQWARRILSS